jgi:hypothetical protein
LKDAARPDEGDIRDSHSHKPVRQYDHQFCRALGTFAHTDGVTDAKNAAGEFFTKDRLVSLLTRPSGSNSAEHLLEMVKMRLYGHMEGADQFDDATMVLVHR